MAMDILIHGTLTAWLTLSVWHRVATFRLGKSRHIPEGLGQGGGGVSVHSACTRTKRLTELSLGK